MAINKNHEFEELNGIKCAIVEKNASQQRIDFLKPLLEINGYTVVIAVPPPPKAAVPPTAVAPAATETAPQVQPEPEVIPPTSFTIGVTDVGFNPVNAIFGRLLKTTNGDTVTLAYWYQKEERPKDEVPYFENPSSYK